MGCSSSKDGSAAKPKGKTYQQAGGHTGAFKFDGKTMEKKTRQSEIDMYKSINAEDFEY